MAILTLLTFLHSDRPSVLYQLCFSDVLEVMPNFMLKGVSKAVSTLHALITPIITQLYVINNW